MSSDLRPEFEKIIAGQATYRSANLGCNLLISRLQRKYTGNQSQTELRNCVEEMDSFFKKYSAIMAKEIELIKKLQEV